MKITRKRTMHGMSRNPAMKAEYTAWAHMRRRCFDPDDPGYKNYGGRGIRVCDRWNESFANFYEDMGPRPRQGKYTLERKDNNKGYYPENCKWATYKEQSRNQRRSISVTINGETKNLADWAPIYNIAYALVTSRRQKGWSIIDALSVPVTQPHVPHFIRVGKRELRLADWARETGMPRQTIYSRIKRGFCNTCAISLPPLSRLITCSHQEVVKHD